MSHIYHIATRGDWTRAQRDGEYTTSTIGRSLAEEGFLHASQATQVADVANALYRGVPGELVLLVIDPDRVRAEIRYEQVPGADAPFPHIYGPLNPDAVVATRPFSPGSDGTFTAPGPPTPSPDNSKKRLAADHRAGLITARSGSGDGGSGDGGSGD